MVVKSKTVFSCRQCGGKSAKWAGQCPDCGEWNTLVEEIAAVPVKSRFAGYADNASGNAVLLADVQIDVHQRLHTNLAEFDRVLGGGLTAGSVVLIGGDPGIGKSTLLLQTMCYLAKQHRALYVTGEESLQQVTMRARRLGLPQDQLQLMAETQVETIIAQAQQLKPQVMVLDSIQTVFTALLQSAPGGVGQVRESAAQLVRFAKQTGTAIFFVGHVTKEGTLAGPRVLEHMVDTVLYFEGQTDNRFRVIRAVKNRFGAVNELGVFAMTDGGLKPVTNPSAIFLSRSVANVAGSVVMVTWEGSRPMLVEVQALVDKSYLANPRRVTVGLEQNRLSMLLAVLHRHSGIVTYDQDVFVNVVGGIRVFETAADLALLAAVMSSLKNRAIASDWVIFGEVGLAGEIRPVQSGQERLREAAKHGFKRAIVPLANKPKAAFDELKVIGVEQLRDVVAYITL